jgi:thioredoxin reductase (NADPH)
VTAEFDIVVAGGGIAGFTAAVTASRLGCKTLVLVGDVLGGQLISINKIDGYPGFPEGIAGYDLCPMAHEQAVAAGAEILMDELAQLSQIDGRWHLATRRGEILIARACVLATGSSLRKLGVPGEERLFGKGVSHCASCDAPLLRGKAVAVVGGGDSAAQEALALAESASRVVMLHRGAELRAQAAYRDALASHPKIELCCHTDLEEILGDTAVTGIRFRDRNAGRSAELDVAGVFVYIGLKANTAFLAGRIALDETGCIPTDERLRTVLPGVAAAGSVRAGWPGRAVAAAGEGAGAAVAVARYLAGEAWR